MPRMSIAEALRQGLREEMARDERVFCIGEDIGIPGGWGGAFTVTLGLEQDFRERMIDTPIAEAGLFGVALGAALMGMRPIADVQYSDFIFCAMDQVVNQIATMRYMSGGTLTVPIVMRAPVGATGRGAQHARNPEAIFLGVPGMKIICPATAYDAKGLLKAAIRDDNPVLMFEHKLLYGSKGARAESGTIDASSDIPDEDYIVPIGQGIVRRKGTDVTIIANLLMMHRALLAAERAGRTRLQCGSDRPAHAGALRLAAGGNFGDEDRTRRGGGGRPAHRRSRRRNRRHLERAPERLPARPRRPRRLPGYPGALRAPHGKLLSPHRRTHRHRRRERGGRGFRHNDCIITGSARVLAQYLSNKRNAHAQAGS